MVGAILPLGSHILVMNARAAKGNQLLDTLRGRKERHHG